MIRITDNLLHGKTHAITARELSRRLNIPTRKVSEMVEYERRDGEPILASCGGKCPGYYLAETSEEIQEYCQALYKRAGEIFKTRRALLATAQEMAAEEGGQL